ncbi:MAG: phosphotransferase [Spirulina sp. SIO3F2]|nr:phosphotransferase [Spirulina sp. SIO3F2]
MEQSVIQVYKNANSARAPTINLSPELTSQDLCNPSLIQAAQELFKADGALVINQLFSVELIDTLYAAFKQQYAAYFNDQNYDRVLNVGHKRKMLTVAVQDPFNDPQLYGNPLLLHLLRGLLGDGFVLGSFGAVIALPGAEAQHIHRDHPPLFEDETLDPQLPSFAVTLVVPLIDLTEATGSTRVWKKSHRVPQSQDLAMAASSVPFVQRGGCYLMDYQLLHGGTANLSQQVRPILYIVYYRSWFQEVVNYEQQARVLIAPQEYTKIPKAYQFLFSRQRELFVSQPSIEQYHNNLTSCQREITSHIEFNQLTTQEQAQRLGELAKIALAQYGLKQARLQLVRHGDNTVFKVVTSDLPLAQSNQNSYQPNHFCLRIHRANYLSPEAIASELLWLRSLSQNTSLAIPEPIPTTTGELCTTVQHPDVPEARTCSLTRWLVGESPRFNPSSLEAIGRLLGQLHHYAQQWQPPPHFTRPQWHWQGLFETYAGYSNQGATLWAQVPQDYVVLFGAVSDRIKSIMNALPETPEQWGLIHGDFWLGNLLVSEQQVSRQNYGMIDFADCGWGYWGYDVARLLSDWGTKPDFKSYLDQVLSGYTTIRAFPEAQLPMIPYFIAAQHVSFALWRIHRAQDHPDFRATLVADLKTAAVEVKQILALFEG